MSDPVEVAGGLVFSVGNDGEPEVLVIDDSFGRVTLPKGHVEYGEMIEEAALREIYEETGIQGRLLCPISRVSYTFTSREGWSGTKDAYYYLVEATGGQVRAQLEEVQGARFVPAREVTHIISKDGYPNNVDVFARGLRLIDEWVHGRMIRPEWLTLSLLTAGTTEHDVQMICRQARLYHVHSVLVHPLYVAVAKKALEGSPTKVCAAIAYPSGALPISSKVEQTKAAINSGAKEVDMVIAIGKLREGDAHYIEQEIQAVALAAGSQVTVKVTLETGLLSEKQIESGVLLAARAGAQVVNTSTGFVQPGASTDTVSMMRKALAPNIQIQAMNDSYHRERARMLRQAGADRLVTPASFRLLFGDASLPFHS